ncbi:beta/gamma crystallin domain-containing protein 1 isoform X2 [Rana temporaria]|uniref:beta/gamma crystallin domain-containing protein 1 isoform X2 n=1 Tax=Rana temporaria TaxID=8407 RepID=UPI001AAD8D70|nr:beta/gamma crystallin domain-containing protein 1 isoform X2 [Rana temporaria]
MSKASPTESPKKDVTRKPVLGKFGNLFNTSKKKQGKGIAESPTSPTERSVTTFKSEKEVVKERKKVILVASSSKVQTQARSSLRVEPASDQVTQPVSEDSALPVDQSEKTTNGNGNIALTDKNTENTLVKKLQQSVIERTAVQTDTFSNRSDISAQNSTSKTDTQNSTAPLVKEIEQTSSKSATAPTDALSDISHKSVANVTPKVNRQNSNGKNVQNLTQSPGRRGSTDGETTKTSVRRLQVFSQETNTTKEESPKIMPRKSSRFSGKVTDSKYKISDKPIQKVGSTEKINSTKLPFQVTLPGDSQDQGSAPAEQSLSPDSAGGRSILRRRASSGDLSPAVSPSEGDIFTGSLQDKPKNQSANGQSNNGKVLAFDIYLSKTGTNSPTTTRSSTSGETMERNSPSSRKTNRKRRSFKSQSSQNDEKKTDNIVPQDDVFDEGSFKGTQEKLVMPDSNVKPAPLSPESNGTVSANQEIKAGANPKLSPKGDSDKDKQQHPASSPVKKKNPAAWAPSSPTVRKAQSRDFVFRNQTVAAAAKVSEFNQPALVSTTKDAYVEKAYVPGSLTGSGGEDLKDTVRDISPTAAGVLPQDRKSIQGVQAQSKTESDNPKRFHSEAVKANVSFNDRNKSTVTSKLNIPPKPKNVELSVKPRVVDTVDESSFEVQIPKGNIASKVSLFESKKTSHRQVDFYATKNISQPKKFVERAKLNFGKQVKGNAFKDSSSTVKSASEPHSFSNKNTESGHGVVKADKSANYKVNWKQSEDISQAQENPMPMEDSRNGLETSPGTINSLQESILPSAENEQHKDQPTELANGAIPVTQGITDSNDLEYTINAEESLLHSLQASDDSLDANTVVLKNSSNSNLDPGHIEMGNKQNSLKPPTEAGTAEEPGSYLTKDSTELTSDHVDSAVTVTLPSSTDKLQVNGSKEVNDTERASEELTLEDKTKPTDTKISKETINSEDIIYNNVNVDMPNRDVQLPTCIDNSKSDDNFVVPVDFPQSEIMNEDNPEKTNQIKSEEVQVREETVNNLSLVQDEIESKPSSLVCKEERLQTTCPTVPDEVIQADQKESITEVTQNSIIYSDETSNEFEGVNLIAEAIPLLANENNLPSSASSQKDSESSDVSSHFVEDNLFASAAQIEDDQAILSSIIAPQDQINGSDAIQDQKSSSVVSQELDKCSVASEEPNKCNVASQDHIITVVEENVANGIVTCSDATAEAESRHTSNEHEMPTPVVEPKDDHSQNTIELSANIKDPSISELDVAVAVDQITEDLENIDRAHLITLNNADVKTEESFSTILNNDVAGANEHVSVVTTTNTLQNGCLDDSYTTILTEKQMQHTENVQNSPGVQKSPKSSFNASIGEDSVLDSSSDMEMFAETIRKLDSPITLPQKRKNPRAPRSPGVYYGLPPIHEDYMEKILDNDAFSFGLGKKNRPRELAPMAMFKMQSKETAEKLKPKRASAEQSMLLKSLRSQREPPSVPQETCDKENADVSDVAVKRSRIESFYSGLKSPFAAREDNVFSPTVTTVSTMTTSFDTPRKEFTPLGKTCDLKTTDCAKTAHTAVRQDLTVPSSDFPQSTPAEHLLSTPVCSMDNHLGSKDGAHADLALSLPDINGQQEENHCTTDGKEALLPLKSTSNIDRLENDVKDIFYFKGQDQQSLVPSLRSGVQSLQGAEKINPRPGKLVILTEAEHGGAVFEVFADIADCTPWELSPTIFIKTIRGCWIIYEHPNFEGRTIPIEEGDIEVTNPWGEEQEEESSPKPVVIGSLRHVIKDYRVCQIDLFTDPGGLGIMTSYADDTEELQEYGRLQGTRSVKVHCGVWLIYEESGFQGIPFILEPGEYPDLSFWNTQEAYIGSLRPLKMGSRKVEIPYEPKIIIFEKPMFEGRQVELDKETMTFENLEIPAGSGEDVGLPFSTVGSMRVLSGLWVGYEKPGFEGHQYLLEEGDYDEWNNWGGYNGLLQSLRPVLSDFSTPHMIMYSEKDLDEKAANINVLGIIANMEETGFGMKIQSINILSGVWVAYECPDFTGEQYILEKGMYSNFSDWGAKSCKISSVQPILMETLDSPWGHFKVEVFSEPDFQGQNQIYEEDVNNIDDSFKIMSCKISSGRWTLYDQADFSGNLWVLEEGTFPNLCAMGCPHDTSIRSLKMIAYEFSEPDAVLFGKENFKGRRVKVSKESTDLQATGYSPDLMSLEVLGGIWVFYEYANYRGRQLLISPSKIAQWRQFSGWNRIGSLRPLRQKRLYFKLRNKESGMMMSTNGNVDDVKLLRIQVMEDNVAEDQIWVYRKGVIRCRISEECSMASAGSLITAGSKLGFSLDEPGTSPVLWSISPEGRIHSRSKPNLVLDVKGGNQYDQQHIVLNPVTEGKLTQLWEICVL